LTDAEIGKFSSFRSGNIYPVERKRRWLNLKICGNARQQIAVIFIIRTRAIERGRSLKEHPLMPCPKTGNVPYAERERGLLDPCLDLGQSRRKVAKPERGLKNFFNILPKEYSNEEI